MKSEKVWEIESSRLFYKRIGSEWAMLRLFRFTQLTDIWYCPWSLPGFLKDISLSLNKTIYGKANDIDIVTCVYFVMYNNSETVFCLWPIMIQFQWLKMTADSKRTESPQRSSTDSIHSNRSRSSTSIVSCLFLSFCITWSSSLLMEVIPR